ncbi:MAG: low-specificity D-threonine aldolase [uncultured Thermomicrobiales bacterium]|uniref:Low-specificity D-threonine aldolase n=1 Tax=uncultured Thermomicrobiales bacterium TaxID=1645740 RepID=A0A6J4U5C2_9BACT|nr:MAG: low-specificity D-threonine aldolase [uncultured Thermomicrobiales bacterium]
MQGTIVGRSVAELDTPALLVDVDAMDRNIAHIAATLGEVGVAWRPHAKGHKTPAIAHRQLAAGAIGITCAKLGEAEVFAASGVRDILVANQIVGPLKTRRLAALVAATGADVMVAVDNPANVAELDAAAAGFNVRPRVVVEVDSGMERCGVAPGAASLELARRIADTPNLRFAGLMAWEGHATSLAEHGPRRAEIAAAVGRLVETAEACRAAGLPVGIVSCGGSGTYLHAARQTGITEVQAGGATLGDFWYRELESPVEPALALMAGVTSRPTADRIVVDAGRKSVDPSLRVPRPRGLDGVRAIAFSAEHGTISLDRPAEEPRPGDRVFFDIGYHDQCVHLHEALYAVRDGTVLAVWPTLARGKLQ